LEGDGYLALVVPEEVQVPVNFRKGSLGVQVLRDGGVIHHFKLQVFGGSRQGGKLILEGLPGIRGILVFCVGMDEGGVDGHSESAKALVIGIMPRVNLRLVGDFTSVIAFSGGFISGDGPPCTNGAEVTSDERGPLEIVGALESGDTANERGGGGGGGGHFGKGRFWNKSRQ